MKSNYLLWLVVAVLVLLGLWYWTNRSGMTPAPATTPEVMTEEGADDVAAPVVVQLTEQSDLGQSGSATLSADANGMLVVTLAMTGGTFAAPQPAHIHSGACPKPGAVVYPLTNVVGGKSVTTLDVTWDELVAAGDPLAVNVHKSTAESSVYTACGDLPVVADDVVEDADTGTDVMQY